MNYPLYDNQTFSLGGAALYAYVSRFPQHKIAANTHFTQKEFLTFHLFPDHLTIRLKWRNLFQAVIPSVDLSMDYLLALKAKNAIECVAAELVCHSREGNPPSEETNEIFQKYVKPNPQRLTETDYRKLEFGEGTWAIQFETNEQELDRCLENWLKFQAFLQEKHSHKER